MTTLPAISLWQPWASLIFTGRKVHETRHWAAPARLIGRAVLIHAAKHPIGVDDLDPELFNLCSQAFGSDWWRRTVLPFGAHLGVAVLASSALIRDAPPLNGAADEADFLCGNWAPGRYAWRFGRRQRFATPRPAKGQQGWWNAELPDADAPSAKPLP